METNENPRKGILAIIILFSVFSVILLGTAWYSSGLAPKMMVRNYRTVKYVAEMQSALTAIYLDAASGKEPTPTEVKRFQDNLLKQQENITETREPELTQAVEFQWRTFRETPMSPQISAFRKLISTLEELKDLNERAMYTYEERALSIGKAVLSGGILGFLLVLIYAVQILLQHERI